MAIEIVVFPIKNGDFPLLCQFTRGYLSTHSKAASSRFSPSVHSPLLWQGLPCAAVDLVPLCQWDIRWYSVPQQDMCVHTCTVNPMEKMGEVMINYWDSGQQVSWSGGTCENLAASMPETAVARLNELHHPCAWQGVAHEYFLGLIATSSLYFDYFVWAERLQWLLWANLLHSIAAMTALRWQQRVWWQSSELVYGEVRSFSRFASRFLIGRSAQVYFQSLSRPDSNVAWLQIRHQKHSVALRSNGLQQHTSQKKSHKSTVKIATANVQAQLCIHIYIYTHVYIYIYVYIHTYSNDNISSCFDLRRKHRGLTVFQVPAPVQVVFTAMCTEDAFYRVKTGSCFVSQGPVVAPQVQYRFLGSELYGLIWFI